MVDAGRIDPKEYSARARDMARAIRCATHGKQNNDDTIKVVSGRNSLKGGRKTSCQSADLARLLTRHYHSRTPRRRRTRPETASLVLAASEKAPAGRRQYEIEPITARVSTRPPRIWPICFDPPAIITTAMRIRATGPLTSTTLLRTPPHEIRGRPVLNWPRLRVQPRPTGGVVGDSDRADGIPGLSLRIHLHRPLRPVRDATEGEASYPPVGMEKARRNKAFT